MLLDEIRIRDTRIRNRIVVSQMCQVLTPLQAEEALQAGRADLIAVGREALYDPNWPLHGPQQYGWWLTRRESLLRKAGFRR